MRGRWTMDDARREKSECNVAWRCACEYNRSVSVRCREEESDAMSDALRKEKKTQCVCARARELWLGCAWHELRQVIECKGATQKFYLLGRVPFQSQVKSSPPPPGKFAERSSSSPRRPHRRRSCSARDTLNARSTRSAPRRAAFCCTRDHNTTATFVGRAAGRRTATTYW